MVALHQVLSQVLRGALMCLCCGLATAQQSDVQAAAPDAVSKLVAAALLRTESRVRYDGSYRRIGYPGGDVPADVGVCTDVVIRAYRALGVDLQQRVHIDMSADFAAYPSQWGLLRPDSNIDHRRVPNLERFLERAGAALVPGEQGAHYRPGDIVTWRLHGRLPHIGIVVNKPVAGTDRFMIVHNVGQGPRQEDVLFAYPIVGHYRYLPAESSR